MDEALVVTDRSGLEGVERRRLLLALGELCNEVCQAPREEEEEPHGNVLPEAWRPDAALGSEDEKLVAGLKSCLGRLASAARSGRGEPVQAAAVRRRLDGAEFVMRREIMMGQGERLPKLLPSFVFLVVLPLLGHAEALHLSERAARLLDP
jgi:hypothetical protein